VFAAMANSPKLGGGFFWPDLMSGPSPEGWREVRPLVERVITRLRSAPKGAGQLASWMEELDRRDGITPESPRLKQPSKRRTKKPKES
jgi:hypothetical protein